MAKRPDRATSRGRRLRRLVFSRRGWRALARRVTRVVPLPSNEPGPTGLVGSLEEIPAVDLRSEIPHSPAPPHSAPRTVQSPHPALDRAGAAPRSTKPLRAAVLPSWSLETVYGFAISPSGQVLAESAWGNEQLLESGIPSARRLPRPRALAGTQASLTSQWCEHYYHWFADALPRFLVLERLGLGELPLLVPSRLSAYQRDSLALLGARPDQLIPAAGDVVRPETLAWPAFAGPSGHPPVWACREIGDRLRTAVGVDEERRGTKRLFISRAGATHRRIVNESELIDALRELGFQTVVPEALSLADQIQLFADAALVVAPHGAGLANMLFARNGTVVEIHEPDNINTCFYELIDAMGHAYWYVLGERFGGHAVGPSYRDIRAPVADLQTTLAEILRARE